MSNCWSPTPKELQFSQMALFQKFAATQSGQTFANYQQLHKWSVDDPELFWKLLAEFVEFPWIEQPTKTMDWPSASPMRGVRWFPGGTLNYAQALLLEPSSQIAVISCLEGVTEPLQLTRRQLWNAVAITQKFLKNQGVKKGDRIAGVICNSGEALVAMLAATSLGATWASCSPDFGVEAVVDRLGQLEPKVVFCTLDYRYNGKKIDCRSNIASLGKSLGPEAALVGIEHYENSAEYPSPDNVIDWPLRWNDSSLFGEVMPLEFEPMLFDDPLFILFSSGTTGKPKGIIHAVGRTLLQHLKEHRLHCDLNSESRLFYFTTCGWMMWNWSVSALASGAAVMTYDGGVGKSDMGELWEKVAKNKISVFGTSPKYIGACDDAAVRLSVDDFPKLTSVLSTGAPLLPEHFNWVYSQFPGSKLRLSSISGGTDIISCFMLGNPIMPVKVGEIQSAGLGMAIESWGEDQRPLVEQKGELVCTKPFVSMPIAFLDDLNGEKYKSAYFARYGAKDVWAHGDFVEITKEGGVIVYGRSDATLNPGGVRIGTAEIYRQVEQIDGISDSIAIGRPNGDGDVDVVLFVCLSDQAEVLDDAKIVEIKAKLRKNLSPRHVPAFVARVSQIPYTRSGKKVELAVRSVVMGEEVVNKSSLSNPEVLDEYQKIAKKLFK